MTIRWRPLIFLALTWWFIITGPGCVATLLTRPCDPLAPTSCEP